MSWLVSSYSGFIPRRVLGLKLKGKNEWDDPEEDGSASYEKTRKGSSGKKP
jgi:hypothetical protein